MDKETLSNYGWIVILILILAVMIALATPFGNFIAGAIKSTTAGFFSVNQNAMNAGGIVIPGQNFDDTSSDETPATLGCDTLYWDGNTDGKLMVEAGGFKMVKVAENVLTPADAPNGLSIVTSIDGVEEIPFEAIQEMYNEYGIISVSLFLSAPVDDFNFMGIATLPEKGVWVTSESSGRFVSITIPGYTGFPHSEHCGH